MTHSVAVTFVRKRTGGKPFEFVKGQFHATTRGTTVWYFVSAELAFAFADEMQREYGKGIYSIVIGLVIEARS